MEKGFNRATNLILRYLGDEKLAMESFVCDATTKSYVSFTDEAMIYEAISSLDEEFMSHLSEEELMILRSYTGYHYKEINALLRGTWNYETNGKLDEETRKKYFELSQQIKKILLKYPSPCFPFVTYRGVNVSAFSKYGITSIQDIIFMKERYMYEEGFTSTSLLSDTSYFGKDLETGIDYNVQIQYLICENEVDGAFLLGDMTSFSKNQNEFLIEAGNLSKIVDVKIDTEKNTAVLVAVLIPKRVWNLSEVRETQNMKLS